MWRYQNTDELYHNEAWSYTNSDELYHYGILGMHWGHRRAYRFDIKEAKRLKKQGIKNGDKKAKEKYKDNIKKAKINYKNNLKQNKAYLKTMKQLRNEDRMKATIAYHKINNSKSPDERVASAIMAIKYGKRAKSFNDALDYERKQKSYMVGNPYLSGAKKAHLDYIKKKSKK